MKKIFTEKHFTQVLRCVPGGFFDIVQVVLRIQKSKNKATFHNLCIKHNGPRVKSRSVYKS